MQDFFTIAKTDFLDTFQGAWIFPLLLIVLVFILWKEKDDMRKLLLGVLPLLFLFIYWCPLTGMLFMKLLGENVYWRILWLILIAVLIPYGFCLLIGHLKGWLRQGTFLIGMAVIVLCGTPLFKSEEFQASTNDYKIPQNVVAVCDLLPYIRLYDPSITLEYGRNILVYNTREVESYNYQGQLYKAAQEETIDVPYIAPLAKEEGCTFLVFSNSRTYSDDWKAYGYKEYGHTDEFTIFVDTDYEEGQNTKKWEE